ncbi:P5CS1, partial [Symbiodinium microadriaticum]
AAQLARAGKEVVVVASGAVGIGKQVLGQRTPDNAEDDDVTLGHKSYKSACAAAGQLGLTALYSSMFEQYGVTSSQLLLTSSDFSSPEKCSNVKEIMEQLLRHGIVPLLNENDALTAIHKEPASKTFSDNDSLAALVAGYLKAELLILLTDVDGLYDRPPSHPGARIISTFHAKAGFEIGEKSSQGRGGMAAKIEAAVKATETGVQAVVIASGRNSETISKILNGENCGTLFLG